MAVELEGLAKTLSDSISGKGGINFEKIVALLSTDSGKRVLSSLLSDGGEQVKKAAYNAKNGNMSGISGIIASVAETKEGRELLAEMMKETKR